MAIALSRVWLVHLGYRIGVSSIDKITGMSQYVTKAAMILGNTVIGGLMATLISLQIALEFPIAEGEVFSIQSSFLDMIFPGILPIGVTFLLLYLIKKKNANPIVLIVSLLVISIIGSFFGIL